MSEKTFQMMQKKLEQQIHQGLKIYVLSSITQLSFDNIVFTLEDICTLVKRLKQEAGKDIWICRRSTIYYSINPS